MLKLIIEKFFCSHVWHERNKVKKFGSSNEKIPREVTLLLECKNCGKLKRLKF